jgi:hypothetical protein
MGLEKEIQLEHEQKSSRGEPGQNVSDNLMLG